jgi:hypothetical protein
MIIIRRLAGYCKENSLKDLHCNLYKIFQKNQIFKSINKKLTLRNLQYQTVKISLKNDKFNYFIIFITLFKRSLFNFNISLFILIKLCNQNIFLTLKSKE